MRVWPDSRPDLEPVNVYCAGVTLGLSRQAPHSRGNPEKWIAERAQEGFHYLKDRTGWWRLWRFMRPETLLAHETLAAQAEALEGWVRSAFEDAVASPPVFSQEG